MIPPTTKCVLVMASTLGVNSRPWLVEAKLEPQVLLELLEQRVLLDQMEPQVPQVLQVT
jgi:hypothetical protein